MDSMMDSLPLLTPYTPTFVWLLVLCLTVLIQGFLAGVLGFANGEEVPGLPFRTESHVGSQRPRCWPKPTRGSCSGRRTR